MNSNKQDKERHSLRHSLEDGLLCLLLTSLIILSCLQIGLRTFFQSGLLWIDPLLRYLVLWCGFMGGVAATGRGKHICLDLVGKRFPGIRPYLVLGIDLFCFLAAGGLFWAGWLFLMSEMEYGAPGLFGFPSWGWNFVFPLSFGLMALNYLWLFTSRLLGLVFGNPSSLRRQSS